MMKTKTANQNKFLKIITMPIKALAKARDFYVRSMNNYADRVYYGPYGASGWAGTNYVDAFPRSVSTSSAVRSNESDDYKELVRAASTSTLGNRVDLGSMLPNNSSTRKVSTSSSQSQSPSSVMLLQQQKGNNMFKGVPRSASVGMAKIEEDKPTEFGETEHNAATVTKKKSRFFPRSKSYAVAVS
ncbi:uncharacterized protein LOC141586625 [Silene latifolia]|uniref:uncharacterized protein LOC141586625 n=1 Tax=Silene latifolia TaxID=37657 RepID=UPI003D782A3D